MSETLKIAFGQLVCWWRGEHVWGEPYARTGKDFGVVSAMCKRCAHLEYATLDNWRERFGITEESRGGDA